MNTSIKTLLCALFWVAGLLALQGPARTPASDPVTPTQGKSSPKESTAPQKSLSAQEIATAQSQGMVWVNLSSGVYHKNGEFYGKTKRGRFMTESEATKAGYVSAKETGAAKRKSNPEKSQKAGSLYFSEHFSGSHDA